MQMSSFLMLLKNDMRVITNYQMRLRRFDWFIRAWKMDLFYIKHTVTLKC